MPRDRTAARIGNLEFHERFDDPVVDVDTEANTTEKTTIDDTIIVQSLGRRADRITVEGIIPENQVVVVDELVEQDQVTVRTHRWSGQAIVLSTSCNYTQTYDSYEHPEFGQQWLYEFTIDIIEVDETISPAMNNLTAI